MHTSFIVRFAVLALSFAALAASADSSAGFAAETRSAEDRARDADRNPVAVLAWLGIGPGMTVMDLVASGGWYTEELSIAVGAEGTVYAQNPPTILQFREGFYDKALSERLADGRLPNVVRLDKDLADAGLAPGFLGRCADGPQSARHPQPCRRCRSGCRLFGGSEGVAQTRRRAGRDRSLRRRRPRQRRPAPARCRRGAADHRECRFKVDASNLLGRAADDRTTMVFRPGDSRQDRSRALSSPNRSARFTTYLGKTRLNPLYLHDCAWRRGLR